jgi:CO/xanthine dehydrogenase Mo-binding subunit
MNRRDFLKSSGALVVSFGAVSAIDPAWAQGPFGTREGGAVDPKQLDSWVAVGADGAVTAYTGKCELGQGMLTAQTQLVAEELCVAFDRVNLVYCDTAKTPDQGTTSGSQSTPTNFNHRGLAQACATAREALLGLASAKLGAAVDQLVAENGEVHVQHDSTRRVSYGDLLASRRFDLPVDPNAKRKPASAWTILGKPIGRPDMADMATGRFEFVHNVRLPGMLHGAVVRPPSPGATLAGVDESSVRTLPGVVKVVVRRNFVGVVAEKPYQALQAASKLKATWTDAAPLPAQSGFYDYMRGQPSQDSLSVDSGDVEPTLAGAAAVIKATYLHPYQMLGSMGTSCAVADVRGDDATVYSPTQSVYPTRNGVAKLLGLPAERVHVIFTRGAGCYGLNGADTVSYDAALLSQAAGRPVRVQLSRRDEMAWENYGYPYVIDQRVGVDAAGSIVAWDCEAWFAALGGRPGYEQPGNVITGSLVGFESETITPRKASPPRGFRNGGNAAPAYVTGCAGGSCGGNGKVKSERVLTHTIASRFFTGPLRSPSRLQNTFAHESLMDEVAAHVKADPGAYRVRHLADARLIEAVQRAAKTSGWQTRPSPNRAAPGGGVARGRGIACVNYEGDNGYSAMVVEAEVNLGTGEVKATRIVVAQDCGPVSNPDGMRNQIEGGALQGLSRALGEEVTWDAHRVTSIDWRTYHSLPLGIEVPPVVSDLIDRRDVPATGSGETSITLVAAALGNAIFDATGVRIREVPFTRERVKAALAARSRDAGSAGLDARSGGLDARSGGLDARSAGL